MVTHVVKTGGPDLSGYRFKGKMLGLVPMGNAGTPHDLGDDGEVALDLPFGFDYYGRRYQRAVINANGYVTFDATSAGPPTSVASPNTAGPNAKISGCHRDFQNVTVRVLTEGAAPNRIWRAQWWQAQAKPLLPLPLLGTFEIQLHEGSHEVLVRQHMCPGTPVPAMGIENHSGTVGLAVTQLPAPTQLDVVWTYSPPDYQVYAGASTFDEGQTIRVTGRCADSANCAAALAANDRTFGWDWDGNGSIDTVGLTATHPDNVLAGPATRVARFGYCMNDGSGCVFDPGQITIDNVPPRFISTPTEQGRHGQPYAYDAVAVDPGPGDNLQYALVSNPAGMTINASTGAIRWVADQAALPANVTISVTDGQSAPVTQAWTIRILEEGGPDAMGYRWSEQGSWQWDELRGGAGTRVAMGLGRFRLPLWFTFWYYGRPYTRVDISRYGYISLEGHTDINPQTTPSTATPNGMIAALLGTYVPNLTQEVYYLRRGNAPNREMIVQWAVTGSGTGERNHFQVVLREGRGHAELRCLDCNSPAGSGRSIGFENQRGDIGLTIEDGTFRVQQKRWAMVAPPVHVNIGDPYVMDEGSDTAAAPTCYGCQAWSWDMDNDGTFETAGRQPDLRALDGPNNYPIAVRGCAGATCAVDRYHYTVNNVAPSIVSTPETTVVDGQQWTYDAAATDPAGNLDTIRWSFVRRPANMTINATTGELSWTPSAVGDVPVTIQAADEDGHSSTQSFTLRVRPAIDPGGPYTGDEGGRLTLDATCSANTAMSWDLDDNGTFERSGDLIAYDMLDGPATLPIAVRCCSGNNCSEALSVIQVANVAPQITNALDTFVVTGQPYSWTPQVDEPAGARDPLEWVLGEGPSGMTIHPTTGVLTWTAGAPGRYALDVEVSDGDGGATAARGLLIVGVDPTLTGPSSVDEGGSIDLSLTCAGCTRYGWDLDDNGTFELTTRQVTFDAAAIDGPTTRSIHARGCQGVDANNCVTLDRTITINNASPSIDSAAVTGVSLGSLYTYAVEASDPADTRDPIQFALPVGPSGMLISSEGVVTWATPTAGVHDVSVVVTDGDGGSARQNFRVTVVSGDARGPYVADEGATIQVRASCSDCDIFEWDLDDNGTFETTGRSADFTAGDGDATPDINVRVCNAARTSCNVDTAQVTVSNVAPTITTTPERAPYADDWSYDADASDPAGDDDVLVWTLPTAPSGMTINRDTGLVEWETIAGRHDVVIQVSDQDGGVTRQEFTLAVVQAEAQGPYAMLEGDTVRLTGQCIACDAMAWDLDDDGTFEVTGSTANYAAADGPSTPTVNFRACAGAGTSNCMNVSPTIFVNNADPSIDSSAITSGIVNEQYVYQVVASDPAGNADTLEYELTRRPTGMQISNAGRITWTPTSIGTVGVTVRVFEEDGGATTQLYDLQITNGIASNGPYEVDEGSQVNLQSTCARCATFSWDLDDDGTFEVSTRTTSFAGVDGPASATVTARGCTAGGDCYTHETTVATANVPPAITSTSVTVATVSTQYRYEASGSDVAGNRDTLRWFLIQSPAGMAVSASGVVTWTPTRGGEFRAMLALADEDGGLTTQTYDIVVPVVVDGRGPYAVDEGGEFELEATCPGCTRFEWDLDDDGTYEIDERTTILAAPDGAASPVVRVRGCYDETTDNCAVVAPALTINNVAPTITSDPPLRTDRGRRYSYLASATDPAGALDTIRWAFDESPTGMTIEPTTGQVLWTPTDSGTYPVEIAAFDEDGGRSTQRWDLIVRVTVDDGGPYTVNEGSPLVMTASCNGCSRMAWDLDDDEVFEVDGGEATLTVNDGPATPVVRLLACEDNTNRNCTVVAPAVRVLNVAPTITSNPPTTAEVGQLLEYQATATDPAGAADAPLVWELVRGPGGMTMSRTGLLEWTPTARGVFTAQIRVTDDDRGASTQDLEIEVPVDLDHGGPYQMDEGGALLVAAQCPDCAVIRWDMDGDDVYEYSGASTTYNAGDGPYAHPVSVRGCLDEDERFCRTRDTVITVLNVAPVVTSLPPLQVRTDTDYTYLPAATDAAGAADPIRWRKIVGPTDLTVDETSGAVEWHAQAGMHTVIIEAFDDEGAARSHGWRIEVVAADVGGPYSVDEAGSIRLAGACANCDTFEWDFDGDGDYDDANIANPMFSAAQIDGLAQRPLSLKTCRQAVCDYGEATLTVRNVPPTITTTPLLTGQGGREYRYQAQATDVAGVADPIRWRFGNAPTGMRVDETTGLVTWTAIGGEHPIVLIADDGDGGVTEQRWTLRVLDLDLGATRFLAEGGDHQLTAVCSDCVRVNWAFDGDGVFDDASGFTVTFSTASIDGPSSRVIAARGCNAAGQCVDDDVSHTITNAPPRFTSTAPTTANLNTSYSYQAVAEDPAGAADPLQFSLVGGPQGLTVTAGGLVSWMANATGSHVVTIRVEDDDDGAALQTWNIDVPGPLQVDAGAGYTAQEGGSVQLQATCASCTTFNWDLDTDGQFDDANTAAYALALPSSDGPGVHHVAVRGCDAGGTCSVGSAAVTIENVDPTIISLPPTTATIDGVYRYSVIATDPGPDTLEFLPTSVPAGTTLHVDDGTLEWVPQLGRHSFSIMARDDDGGTTTQQWSVEVAPDLTDQTINAYAQPGRAEYRFAAGMSVDWAVELKRSSAGNCTNEVVWRTEAAGADRLLGAWPALAPSTAYCWTARLTAAGATSTHDGTFTVPDVPTFTEGPHWVSDGPNVTFTATVSAPGMSVLEYADGACDEYPTSLAFAQTQRATIPGGVAASQTATFETWVKLDDGAPSATRIFSAHSESFMLVAAGGQLFWSVTTDSEDMTVVNAPYTVGAWTHVAVTYVADDVITLYIDGVRRAQRAVAAGAPAGADLGGPLVLGAAPAMPAFTGEMASFISYNRTLGLTELQAQHAAGPGRITVPAGALGAWRFDERTGVQDLYDASMQGRSGVLGASHLAETTDPIRRSPFNLSQGMAGDTAPRTTVYDLRGGPTYCYQIWTTAGGMTTASNPAPFGRGLDTEAPVIAEPPVHDAECSGNNSASVTLLRPTVTDDFDPRPTLAASIAGNSIAFPRSFGMGATDVLWTATDFSGNEGTARQIVLVQDTLPPTVTGGSPMIVEATSPSGTPVTPVPELAEDACSAVNIVHDGPPRFSLGAQSVHFRVTDASNNLREADRVISVVDTTPPTFGSLDELTIAHDGSGCLRFDPPAPTVSDNGYVPAAISLSGRRLGAVDACWPIGSHLYRWTAEDPAGNVIAADQRVNVRPATLDVRLTRIEVGGVEVPFGQFYNAPVTVVLQVNGGTAPYVTFPTRPAASSNTNGNEVHVMFADEGDYSGLLITIWDGSNDVGSVQVDPFGIDTTAPTIRAPLSIASNAVMGDLTTYPRVFIGESIEIERIHASDQPSNVSRFRNALQLEGDDRLEVPTPQDGWFAEQWSVVTWFEQSSPSFAGLFEHRLGNERVAGMGVDAEGRVMVSVRFGGRDIMLRSRPVALGEMHQAVLTHDGRALRLYVDGRPAASALVTGRVDDSTESLQLGDGLIGRLAGTAILERAMRPREVVAAYRGGRGEPSRLNRDAVLALSFADGNRPGIDGSGDGNHGQLGSTAGPDSADPTVVPLRSPRLMNTSGVVELRVTLVEPTASVTGAMVDTSSTATGVALLRGPAVLAAEACNAPVGSACSPGSIALTTEEIINWDSGRRRALILLIEATDAAGNVATRQMPLMVRSYTDALDDARTEAQELLQTPEGTGATSELEDAIVALDHALEYALMDPTYMHGSYLRADQSIVSLMDAADVGVETQPLVVTLTRAMRANVDRHVVSLGSTVRERDRAMHDTGTLYIEDGLFEQAAEEFTQVTALSRMAMDAVVLLTPGYQTARMRAEEAAEQWALELALHDAGAFTMDQMRFSSHRVQDVLRMLGATRDMLRDVVYPEIVAALASSATTERGKLEAMRDVLDKGSNAADEAGDLIAISEPTIDDACLDRLVNLDLDDREFTVCYLRLNDLARELDGIAEPLVYTYHWRAAIGIALFNMLTLTMDVSPTGLPWVAVPNQVTPTLMLPDAELVGQAVALSSVDQNGVLAGAYQAHRTARAALADGDVDAAWSVFVDERCSLIDIFNAYYSTLRPDGTFADPPEPPIDAATYGCQ